MIYNSENKTARQNTIIKISKITKTMQTHV